MKKLLFSLILLFLFICDVSAANINDFTPEEYELLSKYVSDKEISVISDKIVYELLAEDVISYDSMIVATTYRIDGTHLPQFVKSEIVSEDEFLSSNSSRSTDYFCGANSSQTAYCETDYKSISFICTKTDNGIKFHILNEWKSMPKYKSFDLIGMNWSNNVTISSYIGYQYTNGNSGTITYGVGNGNYKIGTNAIGLSQNLVDSATEIENELFVWINCSSGGTVNASYQHAKTNVTLATSKKYNFSSSGMGGVFGFYDGVGSYYDNTPGLSLSYTCS